MKLPFTLSTKTIAFGAASTLLLLVVIIFMHSEAPATAKPIKIVPSAVIDERLFLLRELNELNTSWPDENLPTSQLQKTLASLRQQAMAIRNHLHEGALDDRLTEAYEKFIQTLDVYTTYLEDIGRVERVAENRAEKEASESGFNAGWYGAKAGYSVSDNGGSTSGSLVTGGIVALRSYLWDDYQKGKDRDEAKRQASDAAHSRLVAAVNDYTALCRTTALALSTKYGWRKGEAGFDEPADFSATVSSLYKQGNTDGLAALEQTLSAQRPRDPFVMRDQAYFASLNPQGAISDQAAAAKRCMAAASLVPPGAFYDGFREQILAEAADILDKVSSREIGAKAWGTAFDKNAAVAAQIWAACAGYQSDVTGQLRERKAWDQFKSGDLKGALATATTLISLRQNDPQFACNMACLLSDMGDSENSLAWLRQAIGLGFNNIAVIKTALDLAGVRAQKGKQVSELVAVRSAWKIDYGMFNDDLIIRNDSPFALNHVAVGGSITPNNKAWATMLTVDTIAPGKSYTWSGVFSVPGSKIDMSRSNIRVSCDQGEGIPIFAP